jgi:hypothetical protein
VRHPFLRTLAGSGVTTDPNFENVTLLLHGDGTNGGQNNTFVDGSTNNFTITRNGNTTQGTFSPYGDRWSNYFDGTGDCLVTPANTAFQLGTGDFSVELWYYATTSATSGRALFGIGNDASGAIQLVTKWPFNAQPDNRLLLNATNGPQVATDTVFAVNSWNHIALSRASGTVSIYLNGTRVGNGSFTQDITANQLVIGRPHTAKDQEYVAGYISNFRLVKGTALYSGTTITVPTAPLTAITNTSLLTCQSNRFRDASTNNFTITRNGDVSVQRFSPFSPTAAYAAGTIGGSGYFDGSGDYLSTSISNNVIPTTGDFTAELWIYPTGQALGEIFAFRTTAPSAYSAVRLLRETDGASISLFVSTNGSSHAINAGFSTLPISTWTHLAVVRNGGTFEVFRNGTSVYTSTAVSSGTALMTGSFNYIGALNTGSVGRFITAYLADLRITQSAVYTAAFTPPTAPLTAITNTSLLLNFTNAAILDNAMMAVPETVGNAQISTSVKKYGTGSLEFDGNGDYLHCKYPSADISAFGTGDFTVEFWLYTAVANTSYNVIDWRPTSTQGAYLSFYLQTGTPKVYFNSADRITGGSTIPATTWTHIAICRSGSSMRLFVDGTQSGSTLTNTTNFIGSINRPAIGGFGGFTNDPLNGYIDDLRITKGVARYTANFTPPTAAFPDL